MKRTPWLVMALALVACTDGPTAIDPDLQPQMNNAAGPIGMVSAAGWDLYPGYSEPNLAIALHGKVDGNGVKGSVNWRFADGSLASAGDVNCLEIRGNRAYLTYIATGGDWPGYGTPGYTVYLGLEDNGEGAGSPGDRQTFIFYAAATLDDQCTGFADFIESLADPFPVEWVRGNVQVK